MKDLQLTTRWIVIGSLIVIVIVIVLIKLKVISMAEGGSIIVVSPLPPVP